MYSSTFHYNWCDSNLSPEGWTSHLTTLWQFEDLWEDLEQQQIALHHQLQGDTVVVSSPRFDQIWSSSSNEDVCRSLRRPLHEVPLNDGWHKAYWRELCIQTFEEVMPLMRLKKGWSLQYFQCFNKMNPFLWKEMFMKTLNQIGTRLMMSFAGEQNPLREQSCYFQTWLQSLWNQSHENCNANPKPGSTAACGDFKLKIFQFMSWNNIHKVAENHLNFVYFPLTISHLGQPKTPILTFLNKCAKYPCWNFQRTWKS